jgi:hypothetical protein
MDPRPQTDEGTELQKHELQQMPLIEGLGQALDRAATPRVLRPKSAKLEFAVVIIAGTLSATAAATGHHFFLTSLDEQYSDGYSQFWVKNASNAFAHAVAILLGLVATASLARMVSQLVASHRPTLIQPRCGMLSASNRLPSKK